MKIKKIDPAKVLRYMLLYTGVCWFLTAVFSAPIAMSSFFIWMFIGLILEYSCNGLTVKDNDKL